MATSDLLSLWNAAIGNLGVKTSIAALTEQSAEAAACALNYQGIIEDMVRETDWNCLRRRVALTEAPTGAVWSPSWTYMYLYPTDCFRVRGFDTGAPCNLRGIWTQYDYEVGDDATAGRVIYMNIPDQVLVYSAYTYDAANAYWEAKFDSSLKQAVSWALAASIAGPLTGNASIVSSSRQEAIRARDDARAANANESAPNNMDDSQAESLSIRGYDPYWTNGQMWWPR